MQFYTTARDLQRDITLDLIARFNSDLYKSNSQSESGTEITTIEKRNKYIVKHIKHRILKHLEKLIDAISRGNAIYPTTADELNLRKQYQNKAIGSLESLQNDLEYCVDIYPGKLAAMLRYADSIDRLLSNHGTWVWLTEKVFLSTVLEIFGAHGFDANGGNTGYHGGSGVQYPLYALNPSVRIKKYNGARWWWWLSDDRSDNITDFASAPNSGDSDYTDVASNASGGVAPALCF
jgi:hypothetical protein